MLLISNSVLCDMCFIHSFIRFKQLLNIHCAQSCACEHCYFLLRDGFWAAVVDRTDVALLSWILESDVQLATATPPHQA